MSAIGLVGVTLPSVPAFIAWVAITVTGFGIVLHAALIGWGIHVMASSNRSRDRSFEEARRENERRHQANIRRHEDDVRRHEETMKALTTLIERTGAPPMRPAGGD